MKARLTNLGWFVVAVLAFHLARMGGIAGGLILLHGVALLKLAQVARSPRFAFYTGLTAGFLCYGPQLTFFWNLFGPVAIILWLILATWTGGFVLLARRLQTTMPQPWPLVLIPLAWTALEYSRSELYYLKFSWLTVGSTFATTPSFTGLYSWGHFGTGFVVMLLATLICYSPIRLALSAGLAAVAWMACFARLENTIKEPVYAGQKALRVAGLQLEFPGMPQIIQGLRELNRTHPEANLIVLSEYTFDGPVPDVIRNWCRTQGKYLIAGGKEELPGETFYNTAFVVGPDGTIIHKQVKSVPVQFFKDGQPAAGQTVWNSPWGKIGICICYDLSYRRVMDQFIAQGAQLIICPTMDVAEWGLKEHTLAAQIAPMRAAEYGIPVFRVASSGISQSVTRWGSVSQATSVPGEGEILADTIHLPARGYLPGDRWLGVIALLATISAISSRMFFRFPHSASIARS